MNGVGVFPQLNDPGRVVSVRNAVNGGKLRCGVTNGVVERTVGDLTAVNVNNRNLQEKCRDRSGQHFVSIPQQHDNVWGQRCERVSELPRSSANLAPDIGSGVCMTDCSDFRCDLKPSSRDCIHGVPKFRQQMRAGHHYLEIELWRLMD
jgi:hypothetical protein